MPQEPSNAVEALRQLAGRLGYTVAETDLPVLSQEVVDLLCQQKPRDLCGPALAEGYLKLGRRVLKKHRRRQRT